MVEDFFRDIDRHWRPSSETKVRLRIIGSTALMLRANYVRGTKDSDVIRTSDLTEDVTEQLIRLAGRIRICIGVIGCLFSLFTAPFSFAGKSSDGIRWTR